MDVEMKGYLMDKIYPRINLIDLPLLSNLKPQLTPNKRSCELICPSCWSVGAYHLNNTSSIICKRCHCETTILDAICAVTDMTEEQSLRAILHFARINKPLFESKNTLRWLNGQLKLTLTHTPAVIERLEQAGWSRELITKAPLGYYSDKNSLLSIWPGPITKQLEQVIRTFKGGLIVPWYTKSGEMHFWGYQIPIFEKGPIFSSLNTDITPCHLYHPLNKSFDWVVVCQDPLLASLLIARKIPACAILSPANSTTINLLQRLNKDVYIMAEGTSEFTKEIQKVIIDAKVIRDCSPTAFFKGVVA